MALKVAALAGGVGGAKMLDGLAHVLPADHLTAIVNTGDDFDHLGLRVCPDLDTVVYTLSGVSNPDTGWGRQGETWQFMNTLKSLGGPGWFQLGDQDLAMHVLRTEALNGGASLSQVVRKFREMMGVAVEVLPMTDDRVPTIVETDEGDLDFQIYFVARRCEPKVTGFRFEGVEQSRPAPGVVEAIGQADVVIFCPSNPWVSLGPILAVPGIREAVAARPVVAVTPLVGGKAIKGPAAKMYIELGFNPEASTVAEHLGELLDMFVLDEVDREQASAIESRGVRVRVAQTVMQTPEDRVQLAEEVLEGASHLLSMEVKA